MKKYILILGFILSFSTISKLRADCAQGTDENGYPCGTCGTNCNWMIEDNTLKITGGTDGSIGMMDDYHVSDDGKSSDTPWRDYNSSITSADIQGISNVGDNALKMVGSLKNITFGNTISSIGEGAFCGTRISSVIVPDSVTDIGWAAFLSASLRFVSVPDIAQGLSGRVFGDWIDNVEVICRGSEESCNNIKSQLENYTIYDHQNTQWKTENISNTVKLANESQCTTKYGWNGHYCARKDENGHFTCMNGFRYNGTSCNRIIYTIDEANAAAGKTNTVSIRYR